MRHQIEMCVVSMIFLVILSSFTTLKAGQLTEVDSLTEHSLAKGTALETDAKDSAEAANLSKTRTTLVGKWESPHFMLDDEKNGRDTNGRSLKYQFRADGTYTKTLGGAEVQVEEQGTWSLSEDGAQLLMKSKALCDGQAMTHVATIKHLGMDEMVLEQTLCVAGTLVNAEPKSFYFNKY